MEPGEPTNPPPEIPAFPPSLLRAADHLKAKFQEMPWFIAVEPATIEGRICLALQVKDRGIPPGMVLPTSFETFKVVTTRIALVKSGLRLRPKTSTSPW